jgi:hypothetical protein
VVRLRIGKVCLPSSLSSQSYPYSILRLVSFSPFLTRLPSPVDLVFPYLPQALNFDYYEVRTLRPSFLLNFSCATAESLLLFLMLRIGKDPFSRERILETVDRLLISNVLLTSSRRSVSIYLPSSGPYLRHGSLR